MRILRRALDSLEQDGPAAVNARRVAASAGTSTDARYEFFGDKAGVVRAVYLEGFASLRATLEAVRYHDDARQYVVDLLAATRQFAIERPMLFEVMYSRPFTEFSPDDDTEAGQAIHRFIVGAVRRWLREAGSRTSATEAAHVIVAAHRGFIMTELGGLAGSSRRAVESRYRLGVGAVMSGILAHSEALR